MRRLSPLVALLLLFLAACGGDGVSLDGTGWNLVEYDLGDGAVEELPQTDPTVAFEGDVIAGTDGCNNFTGSYEVSSDNAIEIGPLASTQRACVPEVMDQAIAILSVLGEAATYDASDDELVLSTEDGRSLSYRSASDE